MYKHKVGKVFWVTIIFICMATTGFTSTKEIPEPPLVLALPGWDLSNKAAQEQALRRTLDLKPELTLTETSDFPLIHSKELMLETKDGVLLGATYTHTHMQQNAPLAILIHEERGNRRDFDVFAQVLRDNGISTLAMDLRGHGESRKLANGDDIRYEDFQQDVNSDSYRQMVFDLEAVLDWAESNNLVDSQGIYIIASKMGATVACMSAVQNSGRLKGVVLVNPEAFFRKINLKQELERVQGLPMLVIASDGDTYGQATPRTLNQVNQEVRPLIIPLKFVGINLLLQRETQIEVFKFIKE
ncbi:MAG: alpha/beta hydrolase [Sumerlaeia bacterium]